MSCRNVATLVASVMLALGIGCEDRPVPFEPPSEDLFPRTPTSVKASVGNGLIRLDWQIDDSTGIKHYRIYRRQESTEQPALVDSVRTRSYIDKDLSNGRLYYYQVSAVNVEGFEGDLSEEVSAVPNIYDIIIDEGKEYTNRTSVLLRFTVPETTTLMKISNDSMFVDASWENISRSRTWELAEGDGEKIVCVKFRDSDGNENAVPACDRINLDTKATILQVTEDTRGEVKSAGDIIRFTVATGEPEGSATIEIGNGENVVYRSGIVLYDDETNGDAIAGDGIYTVEFTVPHGIEAINAVVVGQFVDRAGNVAPTMTAPELITIAQPPAAVTLREPSPVESSPTSLRISWTMSNDADFSRYILYRDRSIGVGFGSDLVRTITTRTTTSVIDSSLEAGTTYFYKVYVFDTNDLFSPSNLVSGTTIENTPPAPVVLSRPTVVDSATLRLTWMRSSEPDFASYRLYRSQFSPVDTTIAPIAIINDDPTITQFDDTGLAENVTYFYRIFVYDTAGLFTGSNEVEGRTRR